MVWIGGECCPEAMTVKAVGFGENHLVIDPLTNHGINILTRVDHSKQRLAVISSLTPRWVGAERRTCSLGIADCWSGDLILLHHLRNTKHIDGEGRAVGRTEVGFA